jgi:hypothetical protein
MAKKKIPRVVVVVRGGVMHYVCADEPVEVALLDSDMDSFEDDNCHIKMNFDESWGGEEIWAAEQGVYVHPKLIKYIYSKIRALERKKKRERKKNG